MAAAKSTSTSATKTNGTSYINNPFLIAADGLSVWFAKARNVALGLLILSGLTAGIGFSVDKPAQPPHQGPYPVAIEPIDPLIVLFIIVGVLACAGLVLVIITVINGVVSYTSAEASHGRTVTIKQAWQATRDRFGEFLWLQILTGIKVLLWLLLFIVPGIYMAFRYSLANIAFFDKKLKAGDAIRESLTLTYKGWVTTFGAQMFFNLVTFGIIEPLATASAKTTLYRQFNALGKTHKPAPHVLSKVALGVFIAVVLLGMTFGALVASGTITR